MSCFGWYRALGLSNPPIVVPPLINNESNLVDNKCKSANEMCLWHYRITNWNLLLLLLLNALPNLRPVFFFHNSDSLISFVIDFKWSIVGFYILIFVFLKYAVLFMKYSILKNSEIWSTLNRFLLKNKSLAKKKNTFFRCK